nr:cell division FtsA domain-containing protein [Sporohalobacter salinus]
MHDFNLALIDIGAGTSDIAVTREGTIIGYDMVPVAGDEITEVICDKYMLDYHSAEEIKRGLADKEKFMIKDILDQDVELPAQEVLEEIEPKAEELANLIGERIIELNQKQPQAVICFGGGSLAPLLKDKLAQSLELPSNRVGIKNKQDSNQIEGEIEGVTITQGITPLGIGLSTYLNQNQANFLDVTVNDDLIHLFTLTEPKVSDALLAAEIDFKELEPNLGLALTVEVNDEIKVIPGEPGTAGEVRLNGEEVGIDAGISNGDEIEVEFGEQGQTGEGTIADVVPRLESKEIIANGEKIELKPQYYLDDELVTLDTPLHDRAEITYQEILTVGEAIEEIWDIKLVNLKERIIEYEVNGNRRKKRYSNYYVELNGNQVSLDTEIQSEDELFFEQLDQNADEKLTVDEALEGVDIASSLEIVMNNRPLEIPDAGFELLKNGTETTLDAEVNSGDEITYQPGEMTIKDVLDYINYKLSDDDLEKVEIKKNGVSAQLHNKVADGDQINVFLSTLSQ